jgi:hypothetical protein
MLIPDRVCRYWTLIATVGLIHGTIGDRVNANPRREDLKNIVRTDTRAIYNPLPLPVSGEANDTLSDGDIPTGDGGFARDYSIQLAAGDQIAIELTSESFDTVVILLNRDGKAIGKNDDGPDGSSNSLLFMRIKDLGTYYVRVQGFGATSSGPFKLKITKLKGE